MSRNCWSSVACRSRSACHRVIDALDLDVEEGEIVSLIGPNGAGKTTVFNPITGVYKPDSGSISLDGESIVGPAAAPDCDDGRREDVPVDPPLPEHVRAGERDGGRLRTNHLVRGSRSSERGRRVGRSARSSELAEDLLAFFGERLVGFGSTSRLQPLVRQPQPARDRARDGGETANPPARRTRRRHESAGDPRDHALTARLRDEKGFTVLVIEHDMHVVEGVSDRVVALDHGTDIAEGSFEHVATHPAVVEAYLGKGAAMTK